MRTLRATTLAGTDIQLDAAAVTAFKARLHGALVCPEDPPYEQPVSSSIPRTPRSILRWSTRTRWGHRTR